MFLKLKLLACLLFSVVLASGNSCGSSCGNSTNVTAQTPKYYLFDEGFFYIHGLSNGESVVMYKLQNEKKVRNQYTFLHSDCKYQTNSYSILEDTSLIDETNATKSVDEFSIVGTLNFDVEGTKKTISYKINKNGFEVESDINETGIVYKPSIKTGPHNKNTEVLAGPIPDYKFVSPITLTYLNDGRLFYQDSNSPAYIYGTYTFITSDNKYHTLQYAISAALSSNPVKDFGFTIESNKIADDESYYKYNAHLVTVNGVLKDLYYFIDSKGLHVINVSDIILTTRPSFIRV